MVPFSHRKVPVIHECSHGCIWRPDICRPSMMNMHIPSLIWSYGWSRADSLPRLPSHHHRKHPCSGCDSTSQRGRNSELVSETPRRLGQSHMHWGCVAHNKVRSGVSMHPGIKKVPMNWEYRSVVGSNLNPRDRSYPPP